MNLFKGGITIKAKNQAMINTLKKLGYKSGIENETDREGNEKADELDELREKADELGIKYDKRMGIEKLRALIGEHEE